MTTNAKNLVSELLPCPFCGGNAKIGPEHPELDGDAWTQVYCANAECAVDPSVECFEDGHKESAIRIWNTRALMLAQAGDAVSEPVAWRITTEVINEDMRPAGKKTFVTDDGKQAYLHATNNAAVTPLYTAPHDDGKVARDAERYLEALKTIARTPFKPFPDPSAHSERAFSDAVYRAWADIQNLARAAIKEQLYLSQSTHADNQLKQEGE